MNYQQRRKLLSQNSLYNRALIHFLVRNSSIGQNDTVLEIGPGKGFITSELLKTAQKVIAVEVDKKLVFHLRQRFNLNPKFQLYCGDFLKQDLPTCHYKVFANIPFSIEGQIVRKLLDSPNSPDDCYLVVVRDLAERLSGVPKNNLFSLTHLPWFDFSIYHTFRQNDFIPIPKVNAVMWKVQKKEIPLIPFSAKKSFTKFVVLGFGQGQPISINLKSVLSADQIVVLEQKLGFSLKIKPSYLSLENWIKLYRSWLNMKGVL